jgi:hypothetical protein
MAAPFPPTLSSGARRGPTSAPDRLTHALLHLCESLPLPRGWRAVHSINLGRLMRPCRRSEADELETGPNAREGWEAAVPQPSLGGRFAPIPDVEGCWPSSQKRTLAEVWGITRRSSCWPGRQRWRRAEPRKLIAMWKAAELGAILSIVSRAG